jgi:hypothetical protein
MADFNIFDHLGRQGGAFGGGSGQSKGAPSDGTNEKDTIDGLIMGGMDKTPGTVAKLTGVPIDFSNALNTGVQRALGGDTEGFAGKMILQGGILQGPQGGFLARLLHDIFLKNRDITDHTQMHMQGSAATDGGGGGDFSGGGGGDFLGASSSNMNFGDFVSQASSFDWSEISMASLGGLPRPTLPDMSSSGPELGPA